MVNSGENVVRAVARLLAKVQKLKERATCLQTEDLSSASKLLQFSLRLSETGALILRTYLEVVRSGGGGDRDESLVPVDQRWVIE